MAYRYSVSYPFLDVARRYDIPYEKVLAAVTFLQYDGIGTDGYGRVLFENVPEPPPGVSEEDVCLGAMREIAELVDMPVHLRGGRTDVCRCGREFSCAELSAMHHPATLCDVQGCPIVGDESEWRMRQH